MTRLPAIGDFVSFYDFSSWGQCRRTGVISEICTENDTVIFYVYWQLQNRRIPQFNIINWWENCANKKEKQNYMPDTWEETLSHTIEECGELLAALGKTQRFGLKCYNPEVPVDKRELNASWIRRETADLRGALTQMMKKLEEQYPLEQEQKDTLAARQGGNEQK